MSDSLLYAGAVLRASAYSQSGYEKGGLEIKAGGQVYQRGRRSRCIVPVAAYARGPCA